MNDAFSKQPAGKGSAQSAAERIADLQQVRGEITQYLDEWRSGDLAAFDQLIAQVYDELHLAANRWLRVVPIKHTLPPTALVSELYLRFAGVKNAEFESREQFFAFAGILLRQILVDYVRFRKSKKRGGDHVRESADHLEKLPMISQSPEKVLAIHEALKAFEKADPRKAKVIELRFFGGFKVDEIALALDVSNVTVSRDLAMAKLWLARKIGDGKPT